MAITNAQLAAAINDLINHWQGRQDEFHRWLSGPAGGGDGSDGRYPLTDYFGTTVLVKSPAQLEEDVESIVSGALAYKNAAEGAALAAANSASEAGDQAGYADVARIASEAAQVAAEAAQSAAEDARNVAIAQANKAVQYGTDAQTYAESASDSADAAASSAQDAADAAAVALAAAEAAELWDPSNYYTKAETDDLLDDKSNVGHTHVAADLPLELSDNTKIRHPDLWGFVEILPYNANYEDGTFAQLWYNGSERRLTFQARDSGNSVVPLEWNFRGVVAATQDVTVGGTSVSLEGHTHSWSAITGKPSTFAPSAHTHTVSDLTAGDLTMNRIRLLAGNDASHSSTGHAFQLGSTEGTNLIMDANEIMVRNNGEKSNLYLNWDGGDVYFGENVQLTAGSYIQFANHYPSDKLVMYGTPNGTNRYAIGLENGVMYLRTYNSATIRFDEGSTTGLTVNGSQLYVNSNRIQFPNQSAQKINLYGDNYALGVESNTLYFRTNRYFRWYNAASDGGSSDHMQLDCNSSNLWVAGNVTAYSDRRVKEDLQVIDDALSKVRRLSGYTFRRVDTGERQAGVVAQEVREVLPEVVFSDDKGNLSVAYGNLVALLIEAIKELDGRVR